MCTNVNWASKLLAHEITKCLSSFTSKYITNYNHRDYLNATVGKEYTWQIGKEPYIVKTGSSAFMILTLTNITAPKNNAMVTVWINSGKSQGGRGPQWAISSANLMEDRKVFYGRGRNMSHTSTSWAKQLFLMLTPLCTCKSVLILD